MPSDQVPVPSDQVPVPCQPDTILTVTDMQKVGPPAGKSGAARLTYQLCNSGRSFERWMYAKALAQMINRHQLEPVPKVSHQEAFGRRKNMSLHEMVNQAFKALSDGQDGGVSVADITGYCCKNFRIVLKSDVMKVLSAVANIRRIICIV